MKRLLLLVVAVAALAAFGASSTTAATHWLAVAPTSPTSTDAIIVSGTAPAGPVTIEIWTGTCVEEEGDLVATTVAADGTFTTTFDALPAGVYAVYATSDNWTTWDCVDVTVTQAAYVEPPHFGTSYLCWNREMVNPVAYEDNVADEMWKTGKYFEPQAVLGNVVDGTNIGAYHLVCNAPATMKITDIGIGGSGEVYDTLALDAYHHAHQGGNDLNVYHVWR